MLSFLYVEPYEVRHEILVRVRDMEEWMDLGLRGDTYIEVDELDGFKKRIGEFLLGKIRSAWMTGHVYDKLAFSISGDLLADVYLQNRKSFAIQKAGGAQAKVKAVEIQEASARRLDDRPLVYSVKGRWTALGSVGHWGHVHMRQNLYDAIVTVEAVDGSWKITELELLEEKRIDPNAQTSG